MKTIVGLYTQPEGATEAMQTLESVGFSKSSVRVLRSVQAIWQHLGCTPRRIMRKDFVMGAALGIAAYSLFGVLVAVGQVTMGFERVAAIGGLLIYIVIGGFVGGMLGLFFGMGDAEQETRLYTSGIRRGGVLVVVRTADEHAQRALDVLRQTEAQGVKICWRTSDHPEYHGLPRPKDRFFAWVRWGARVLGLALLVIVIMFLIGEGIMGGDMPDLLTILLR